jgi:hypothetical protein
MIIEGVLSHGTHLFRVPEEEAQFKIAHRDSGPKPKYINEQLRPKRAIANSDAIKNKLIDDGRDQDKLVQYTWAQHKDPATNDRMCAFYSPLFSNYYSPFLSKFYGVNENLSMALFTRKVNMHQFLLDIEIINKNGMHGRTYAEYNNIDCRMKEKDSNGFKDLPRNGSDFKYTYLDKPDLSVKNNGASAEFFKNISGNVSKNVFFLSFMNKKFTDTKEAEGMAKLILKAGGDADQVLALLQEVLYYSLLIYKDKLLDWQAQAQAQPSDPPSDPPSLPKKIRET